MTPLDIQIILAMRDTCPKGLNIQEQVKWVKEHIK